MSIVIDYTKGFFEPSPAGETVGDITSSTLDLSTGNVFSDAPTANVTYVFSNPPASGTAYGFTLKVTGTEVTVTYDLVNASYDSVSFSVASEDSLTRAITFNNDGTKMYMVGDSANAVYQYTLSTAFDLSTASYDSVSFSVGSETPSPYGIAFNNDGTKMYVIGGGSDAAHQYTLSTAFDLSTASYDSVSFSVGSEDGSPLDIAFNSDGTKMYMVGFATDTVYQYTLSTAFDLTTASYDSVSFSPASEDATPYGIAFNNDGTKMYMVGDSTNAVYQYTLSTSFDLSTSSYDSVSFSVGSEDGSPYGITFNNDGTKMYVIGDNTDAVYQYSTSSTFTPTITWPASVDWPSGTAPTAPASGETSVFVFYTQDGGTTYYGFVAGEAMA